MLRLLRNMKVSTKLITVLAAPVVVLIILAALGVTTRRAEANDANRIEELTQFVQVDANLVNELQKETVWSAAYMSTVGEDGTVTDPAAQAQYRAELDAQRQRTDDAMAAYQSAVDKIDPGKGNVAASEALQQANERLRRLDTNRRSVDGVQAIPKEAIETYTLMSSSLIDVNSALVQSANDAELLLGLTTTANFERVKEARAKEAALLTSAVVAGAFTDENGARCQDLDQECVSYQAAITASNDAAQATDTFSEFASPDNKRIARSAEAGLPFNNLKQKVIEDAQATNAFGQPANEITVAPDEFTAASFQMIDKLKEVDTGFIAEVDQTANSLASDASNEAFLYLLFTAIAVVAALVIAFLVARATTVPLRKLTSAAYTLSTDKLPGLVERLRNPDEADEPLSATLTPIDINSKDEIGQLADAFNSIQQVTVEVAEEQAQLLRKGIGDIFINLARRNQTLLDRQIEFIDQLEANEEDPDQLDNLFKLDHLATRMRRNAESLLVLAGAEPPRRRGRPVGLSDVVRVAIGEVEDFARIQLLALDDATVGGNVAVDLAHLLSELMENATHFSPPDTVVEIVGHRADDRSYVISVSDQGIGMSAEQLSDANVQLAHPPLVGLALSRSLGFIVIGRLAQRFGISVKLTASPSGGVTALVTLPRDLVTYADEPGADEAPTVQPPPASTTTAEPPTVVRPGSPAGAPSQRAFAPDPVVAEPEPGFERSEPLSSGLPSRATDFVVDEPAPDTMEPEPEPVSDASMIDAPLPEPPTADLGEPEPVFGGIPSDELLDELLEEVVPEGDEFERGLQSLVDDQLAPGPVEPAPAPVEPADARSSVETEAPPAPPVPEPATTGPAPTDAKAGGELTAAGLVRRTPKKRATTSPSAGVGGSPVSRAAGPTSRSPEEVRKMLSRYRSGLNKGRGDADSESSK